jgi:hypothetical protein
MGVAEDWQSTIGKWFLSMGWNIFNPRRTDWDSIF